MLGYYVFRV